MENVINEVVAETKTTVAKTKTTKVVKSKVNYTNLDAAVGFNLGWDAYASGLKSTASWINENSNILKGWKAANLKQVTILSGEPDRYVRKCLKLRFNAWTRGRAFNQSITPEFIKAIDVKYCPVTLEELTNSTGLPTDGSVDRINNNGGYGVTNLAIMSARANYAKSTLNYHKIHGYAHNPDAQIPTELFQVTKEATAYYKSGSGTNVLVFKYVVRYGKLNPSDIKVSYYGLRIDDENKAIIKSSKALSVIGDDSSIEIHVEFDDALEVDHTVTLPIQIGRQLKPLTRAEWARMAVICSHGPASQDDKGVYKLSPKITPCVIFPPPCTLPSVSNLLQMGITFTAYKSVSGSTQKFVNEMKSLSDRLVKGLSAEHKVDFKKLVNRAKKVKPQGEILNQWFNTTLFGYFFEFYRNLTEAEKDMILDIFHKDKYLSSIKIDRTESLNFDKNGYTASRLNDEK